MSSMRECLHCGMLLPALRIDLDGVPPELYCPKCDANLYLQSNGSCLSRDIAHQHETIDRALDKLDAVLEQAWSGYAASVRVIVGGGLIREQVLGQLLHYRERGRIFDFEAEAGNSGAVMVRIRA